MIRNRYNRSSDTCCNTYCCCDCYSYWESPCRCPEGITGATGATGPTGEAGTNGKDGATGAESLIPTKQFRSVGAPDTTNQEINIETPPKQFPVEFTNLYAAEGTDITGGPDTVSNTASTPFTTLSLAGGHSYLINFCIKVTFNAVSSQSVIGEISAGLSVGTDVLYAADVSNTGQNEVSVSGTAIATVTTTSELQLLARANSHSCNIINASLTVVEVS